MNAYKVVMHKVEGKHVQDHCAGFGIEFVDAFLQAFKDYLVSKKFTINP